MTKKTNNSHPNRLREMFLYGSKQHELNKCLAESKAALIRSGAKADNLPTKPEDQALFIAKLNDKSLPIIRAWFSKNADFGEEVDAGSALEILGESGASAPGTPPDAHWRAILAAYVSADCSQRVKDFVFPPVAAKVVNSAELSAGSKARPEAPQGAGVPADLPAAPRDSQGAEKTATGLKLKPVAKLEIGHELEAGADPILGMVKNILPSGQFFARVAAIVKDGALLELSPPEAQALFPESGDATAFPGTPMPGFAPHPDAMAIWRVEQQNTTKKTQFSIRSLQAHVYHVKTVPHASDDPDKVREWLNEQFRPSPGQHPLFQLADGLLVRLPGDVTDPRRFDFDNALHAYRSLEAYDWHGERIIIGDLPAHDFLLDCSPTGTLVKRMFRHAADAIGIPQLTRAQIKALAEAAEAQSDAHLTADSIRRASTALLDAAHSREILLQATEEIMSSHSVKQFIEQQTSAITEGIKKQKQAEATDVEHLRQEKLRLGSEIEEQKKQAKKQAGELSKEIRKAFERAKEDGMKTLAEATLLKGLLGLGEANPASPRAAAGGITPATENAPAAVRPKVAATQAAPLTTPGELETALRRIAEREGLSGTGLRLAAASLLSCGLLGVLGQSGARVSNALAVAMAAGASCCGSISSDMFSISDLMNAPVAPVIADAEAMTLSDFIAWSQEQKQVCLVRLRGANRAPPESFLSELFEAADPRGEKRWLAWTERNGRPRLLRIESPILVVLELVPGETTFPLDAALAARLPIFHADIQWADEEAPDTEAKRRLGHAEASLLYQLSAHSEGREFVDAALLPTVAKERLQKIHSIGSALGSAAGLAKAGALMSFGIGRIGSAELVDAIDGIEPALGQRLRKLPANLANLDQLSHLFKINER